MSKIPGSTWATSILAKISRLATKANDRIMEQSEYYGDRNSVELESPDKVWSQWDSCRDDASSLSVPKDTNMSGNEGLTEAFVDSFCENMEKYELVKDISSGNFGVARLMRAKNSKELVAVKFIERGPKVSSFFIRIF